MKDEAAILEILGLLKLHDFVKGFVVDRNSKIKKQNYEFLKINMKLQVWEFIEDWLVAEIPTSPLPICNDLGIQLNTKTARYCLKPTELAQRIIFDLNGRLRKEESPDL